MVEVVGRQATKGVALGWIHLLMLISSLIVASSFTVGEAITRALEPTILLLVRYVVAVLCLLPLIVFRHRYFRPSWSQLGGYALISTSTVGFFWCMFAALRYTTALNTSIIFTVVPGVSGVYSAVFLGERLGWPRLCALFCGMLGAVWVIFHGDLHRLLALEVNKGDLLFLGGCFVMAAYTPLVKTFHRQESMVVMTFWVLLIGLGWFFILALPRLSAVVWLDVSSQVWWGIIYLAVFSTVITFYLTHLATIYLGPTRVMAYSYFYPGFVLAINWGYGHGLPPAIIWPGIIVVSLATIILQRGATGVGE